MPTQKLPSLLSLFLFLLSSHSDTAAAAGVDPAPTPARWPEQFHARLYTNLSNLGVIRVDDLWYDWPNRRNLFIMQQQLSDLLYDVEWDNGTTFYFTVGPGARTCRTEHFPVGILRPGFLQAGAKYLGRALADGFLCNAWEKLEFIWYYEDVATRRPVRWDFYDGIQMHVMTFEVGAVLADPQYWQAPAYCFAAAGDGNFGGGSRDASGGGQEEEEEGRRSGLEGVHRRLGLLNHHGDTFRRHQMAL